MKQMIFLFALLLSVAVGAPPPINYPAKVGYVDTINSWASTATIAEGMGIPGYAPDHGYNYILLAFWSYGQLYDMVKVWENPQTYFKQLFGSTKDQTQRAIVKRFHDKGIYLLVSAFGATVMPTHQDPTAVANALAEFTLNNHLDGVDIDYEDNGAMVTGTGQTWLITLTKQLRKRLPDKLIMHAPQAPYFSKLYAPKGGYLAVHEQVGSMIDLYLVQFYNQGSTTYDTYKSLFVQSNGWSTGTSVKEIISKGVPSEKLVVGKPVLPRDVVNTGWVNQTYLGNWTARAYDEFQWYTGYMGWQYKSDVDGQKLRKITGVLSEKYGAPNPTPINDSSSDTSDTTQNTTNTTNTTNNSNNNGGVVVPPSTVKVSYPIRFTYVNFLTSWWPASAIAKGLGVPGYSNHNYNYVALAFWGTNAIMDIALVWQNPVHYMGSQSQFGSTNDQIRASLVKKYHDAGVKVMVSAFGATNMPTHTDPVDTATKLAKFVTDYSLDGADIDYEDNEAMEAGKGEEWLIAFTRKLRQLLPNHIISHAPQGPYFKDDYYPNRGYVAVHEAVGDLIDFYNVQFYNQGNTEYDTYNELFIHATGFFSGTSVQEIINKGVPSYKIVVGKPATPGDAMNTGYVAPATVGTWVNQAFDNLNWYAGVMFWQFKNDQDGLLLEKAAAGLITRCKNAGIIDSDSIIDENTNNKNDTNNNTDNNTTNVTDNSTDQNSNNNTTNTTDNTTDNTNNTNNSTIDDTEINTRNVNYPVKVAYVNSIASWISGATVAEGMGVPGYAPDHSYNYIALAFWSYGKPLDMAKVWDDPQPYLKTTFGNTKEETQRAILKRYHDKGIQLIISAFGATEMPTNQDPVKVADALADYTIINHLDGVDIDYEDNAAMQSGAGQTWLIEMNRQLRKRLPNRVIMHAPQGPYFSSAYAPKGGYLAVDKAVGSQIDLYLVQFYNQGTTTYDSYTSLFTRSNGWSTGTSVKEIMDKGVPLQKIVVGKPTLPRDATNTGWVNETDLGGWCSKAYDQLGWYAGIMQWQYKSDTDGQKIRKITDALISKYNSGSKDDNTDTKDNSTDNNTNNTTNNTEIVDNSTDKTNNTDTNNNTTPDNTTDNTTNNTNITDNSTDQNTIVVDGKVNYPVRMANINSIKSWWPPSAILKEWGVPGYATPTIYNYFALEVWSNSFGASESAIAWTSPETYLGYSSGYGNRKDQIQANIVTQYHNAGIKILISAFSNIQFPTSMGLDPVAVATKLATYVKQNHFDGVNVKYRDFTAIESGSADTWLISFYTQLRNLLPNHIIASTVKPKYCSVENKHLNRVNKQVGNRIDFYIVEYYHDGDTLYDTYSKTFVKSTGGNAGTAVQELIAVGFQSKKLVLGKTVSSSDLYNQGWVNPTDLGTWTLKAYNDFGWFAGVCYWQYYEDMEGTSIKAAMGSLTTKVSNSRRRRR